MPKATLALRTDPATLLLLDKKRLVAVATQYGLNPGTLHKADLLALVRDHMSTVTSCPTCHGLQCSVDTHTFPPWGDELEEYEEEERPPDVEANTSQPGTSQHQVVLRSS